MLHCKWSLRAFVLCRVTADAELTIADLETLGERLTLPDGWRYETRVLTEDSELKADGLAYVINDDLGNSYQKILR